MAELSRVCWRKFEIVEWVRTMGGRVTPHCGQKRRAKGNRSGALTSYA